MVKHVGRAPPRASVVWIAPPSTIAFATPKGLKGVVLAVFATAVVMLAGFVIYIYQRRKLRAVSSRSRRGKGFSGLQQTEPDVIYDDGRRGARVGARRSLPWPLNLFSHPQQRAPLFPDAPRGFSFPLDLERLWSGVGPAVVEATVDDLADVLPYTDTARASTSGPRFMATTASGKSLQVVVKTAAVPSRQPLQPQQPGDRSQQDSPPPPHLRAPWQDASASSSARQLAPGVSQGAVTSTSSVPLTPALSTGSAGSDFSDGGGPTPTYTTTSFGPAGRGPTLRATGAAGAGSSAPFGAPRGAGGVGTRHDLGASAATLEGSDDEGFPGLQRGGSAGRHAGYGDVVGVSGAAAGVTAIGTGAVAAAGLGAPTGSAGGGVVPMGSPAGAGGGGGSYGRVSEAVDPAAAWYSRALHRQVSAAAAATQASAPAPKVHVA